MKEILEIANTISPLAVIALLALAVLYLARNSSLMVRIRGTQINDRQKVSEKVDTDATNLEIINKKLDLIMENHLSELPEMKKTLDRIESVQREQGERLACVETATKILLKQ